jgi:chromosome segregation ATPase
LTEQRAQNSFKEELMRTKEQLSEKSLRVKAVEMDNEKLKDEISTYESKIYKKEDQIRQQEADILRLQRDVEVLRDSFTSASSKYTTHTRSGSGGRGSSLNDMESIMQGMEEQIQQLQHELQMSK